MKNLKNLGKTLSKTEQKTINGGACPDNAKEVCEAKGGIWKELLELADCGYCDCSGDGSGDGSGDNLGILQA